MSPVRPLAAGAVASPCNSVCTMDAASGLCAGCYRTLDEIARWSAMSDDARRAVLAALHERRERASTIENHGNG